MIQRIAFMAPDELDQAELDELRDRLNRCIRELEMRRRRNEYELRYAREPEMWQATIGWNAAIGDQGPRFTGVFDEAQVFAQRQAERIYRGVRNNMNEWFAARAVPARPAKPRTSRSTWGSASE